jgi:hypothetical protein
MLTNRLLSVVLVGASLATFGCSGNADSETDDSEDAVTGVTDLTELEAAFHLQKDTKDAQGNWSRGPGKLKGGPCYKKLVGSAGGANFEFRRYSEGAAFFRKGNTGAASGEKRPILCVDIDTDWGNGATLEVSELEIDAAIRYRLGRPSGSEGAAGSTYQGFQYGYFRYRNAYCNGFDPATKKGLEMECLGEVSFPGSANAAPESVLLAYQYAWKVGKGSNVYSFQDDPVGRYVSSDGDHIRFEKVDAHRFVAGNKENFALTPKNSDGNVAGRALALCSRSSAAGEPGTRPMTCRGL